MPSPSAELDELERLERRRLSEMSYYRARLRRVEPYPALDFKGMDIHVPVKTTKRRCSLCSLHGHQRRSMIECAFCRVALCLSHERNCFQRFHQSRSHHVLREKSSMQPTVFSVESKRQLSPEPPPPAPLPPAPTCSVSVTPPPPTPPPSTPSPPPPPVVAKEEPDSDSEPEPEPILFISEEELFESLNDLANYFY